VVTSPLFVGCVIVDVPWMRQQLEEFIAVARQSIDASKRDDFSLLSELRKREFAVKEILRSLDRKLAEFELEGMFPEFDAIGQAERGLGMLADRDEVAARLAPDAPVLPADKFHPWVWDSARTLWESHHYRQAVQAAATTLNAKIQDKVQRRDVSDTKLIQDAFSESAPVPGKPRLRMLGDPSSETVQSRQRGALQFGLACVSLIRNPASHEDEEWDEQVALEQLAALSVFARLADECQVVNA
jgi:Protein of unknown function (Hypoth_ymh)